MRVNELGAGFRKAGGAKKRAEAILNMISRK